MLPRSFFPLLYHFGRRVRRPLSTLPVVAAALLVVVSVAAPLAQPAPSSAAAAGGAANPDLFKRIDEVVLDDIKAKKLHGAVVLVGQRDRILYRKAFGDRAVEPSREPMTLDTIFDAASLTKVVATTTSVMILVQEGRLRLNDRVSDYVPGFERYGKQPITIRHLLTHMSGLRPDIDWSFPWVGYDKAIELAIEEVPLAAPNERFIYSDINFFLLGHIVGKVAGVPLAQFALTRIFEPLGMKDTMFTPPATLRPRIAPTERCRPLDYPCSSDDAAGAGASNSNASSPNASNANASSANAPSVDASSANASSGATSRGAASSATASSGPTPRGTASSGTASTGPTSLEPTSRGTASNASTSTAGTASPPSSAASTVSTATTSSAAPSATGSAQNDPIWLRGIVHDPTSRRMGGVAGHAGLFTTVDDLAIFCRMLLGGGAIGAKPGGGTRVLSPLTVARMIAPSTPSTERNQRGLGWDLDSSFSANRGELLPIGSIGHTGFTGTSIWIDPLTGAYVVFMSSRVHPDGKGDVTPLRARVATIAAAALTDVPPLTELRLTSGRDFGPTAAPASATGPASTPTMLPPVMTGIDVLRAEGFARLKGRKVGLVTNQTGRARDGATTIDLLFGAKNLTLVALFSPEHGIRGVLDQAKVDSSRDEKTGLTIHSLYGETRRPTDTMLKGIDTLVIDLQDIGARFWTYVSTMVYVMEEAAKRGLEVVVLDRPNPINGWQIEGPTLDRDNLSFVGLFPMPTRHGMTLGELAQLYNGEQKINAMLTVVQMKHWRRDMWFDQTGLPWINPSPNMRNMVAATLYPGIGSIEATNTSVGRGTDTPFEHIGAPWIDGVALASALNARRLPGIQFYPTMFTPTSSKYANESCQGVFMIVTDRVALRPVRVGIEIAATLAKLHRSNYVIEPLDRLVGSRHAITRILNGDDPAEVAVAWAGNEARWRLLRAKYLLYR